jgi:hypothetical protein
MPKGRTHHVFDSAGLTVCKFDLNLLRTRNPDEEYKYSTMSETIRRYAGQSSRNVVVGMANNFFSYISEVLQSVLTNRPEILRSSERITTEEVLQFSNVGDIVAYVADRKLNELSYGGLKGVESFLKERLGVGLFESDQERVLLTILSELRNIHTHNRGIINRLFLSRVGRTSYQNFEFQLGERSQTSLDEFAVLARNAIDIALRLDRRLSEKFSLEVRPFVKAD